MNTSKYTIYSLGYVAEDKDTDDLYVNVYPIEITPDNDGDLNSIKNISTSVVDNDGKNLSVSVNKSNSIRAKWKGDGGNRITAPDVCNGETVLLWNYAGTDRFYWSKDIPEPDLRKRERAVYFFSSKALTDSKDVLDKGYSFIIDTVNKYVRLFTSKTDGEATTYEIYLDTQNGLFSIEDGVSNVIKLDSLKGSFETVTKNKVRHDTKKFAVSNGSDELIALLVELIDANITEKHIGNLGRPTVLDGSSKSKYSSIKSRLSKFLDK